MCGEVKPAPRELSEPLGEQDEVTEAVVPVTEPLAAVAVRGEAPEEVQDVGFGRRDEIGLLLPVAGRQHAGDRRVGQAHGVPVVRGCQPPGRPLAALQRGAQRPANAAGELLAHKLPDGGRQAVAQELRGDGQVRRNVRGAEVDGDGLLLEVDELPVMRGHDPGGLRADCADGRLQRRNKPAPAFEAFGQGQRPQAAAPAG